MKESQDKNIRNLVKISMCLTKYGGEEKAIKIAKQKYNHSLEIGCVKPSEMCPDTTVFKLVDEIWRKGKNSSMKRE